MTHNECDICKEKMASDDQAEMADDAGKIYECHPDCGIGLGLQVA
jgi:hypothetical protein|tara:strand:+ start:96 stop:230 length:135 start_codon:yes stop_codon:yes gene_type:complete